MDIYSNELNYLQMLETLNIMLLLNRKQILNNSNQRDLILSVPGDVLPLKNHKNLQIA